jgi:hypothetical protein
MRGAASLAPRPSWVAAFVVTTEDAYLVVIYLDPPRELVIHLRGGRVRRRLSGRDNTVILDLQTEPRLSSSGGFHSINVYLPHALSSARAAAQAKVRRYAAISCRRIPFF